MLKRSKDNILKIMAQARRRYKKGADTTCEAVLNLIKAGEPATVVTEEILLRYFNIYGDETTEELLRLRLDTLEDFRQNSLLSHAVKKEIMREIFEIEIKDRRVVRLELLIKWINYSEN